MTTDKHFKHIEEFASAFYLASTSDSPLTRAAWLQSAFDLGGDLTKAEESVAIASVAAVVKTINENS